MNNMEKTQLFPMPEQRPIFALDIGTHSIIGIVGVCEKNLLRVLKIIQREYPRRAMIDGQIEDIEVVAEAADGVRRQLESELELSLSEVYVAAAGRSLKTQHSSYEVVFEEKETIQHRHVIDLEMCAIQQAEEAVLAENPDSQLYYIGHSVMRYYLDDYPLSTLVEHRGKKIRADIIATFLPAEVLESLYAAMRRIGLTINNVTLEPIAAMNAIIPRELRMLNLALVDIGAGTSDIALSEGGSVVAYTMATVAGDEITEAIVQNCLVDFQTAEEMKLSLSQSGNDIAYHDILGFEYTISKEELREKIAPAVKELSSAISAHIQEANGKAPAAVFMVGGGSKLPGLCALVAEQLGIAENKVAVGGNNYMKKMIQSDTDVSGPEYATPMGIALTAMDAQNSQRYNVSINGKLVQISSQRAINILELLLNNGFERNQLLGRSGKSVTFELNGNKQTVRGGRPTLAVITINDKPASITTQIQPDDVITVIAAQPGADAAPKIEDVVERMHSFIVTLNETECRVGSTVFINGKPASKGQYIHDMDVVAVEEILTLEDLCKAKGITEEDNRFEVNKQQVSTDYWLQPGDDLHYYRKQPQAEPLPPEPTEENEVFVQLNGRMVRLLPKEDQSPYLFVDLLNYVDIDPTKPEGNIVLKLNGQNASYLSPIQNRDTIDIYWDK